MIYKKTYILFYLLNASLSKRFSELATTQATAASPVTFTEVLIMSKILSTAKIKPIASKGSPNELKINAKVIVPADGTAAAPTFAFDNSATTGLFRSAADVIGVTIGGTETFTLGATGFDTPKLQVDTTLGNTTPFFKVDPTTNNVLIGCLLYTSPSPRD